MELKCIKCSGELLPVKGPENWSWVCSGHCLPPLDTGVSIRKSIPIDLLDCIMRRDLNTSLFEHSLSENHVAGVKVLMPLILHHYIECRWGACYMCVEKYALVPHLDQPNVLDYILRSPVVHSSHEARDPHGIPYPKMYAQLYESLRRVNSAKIREYLKLTFPAYEPELMRVRPPTGDIEGAALQHRPRGAA